METNNTKCKNTDMLSKNDLNQIENLFEKKMKESLKDFFWISYSTLF